MVARKPLSAKQKAQRSVAAKASAAKRKKAPKYDNSPDTRAADFKRSQDFKAKARAAVQASPGGVGSISKAAAKHLGLQHPGPSKAKTTTGKGPQATGKPAFTTKPTTYNKTRAKGSPVRQAAAMQSGPGRYGAMIQYHGKSGTSYDIHTRRAKKKGAR